jgi:hypothetical protein
MVFLAMNKTGNLALTAGEVSVLDLCMGKAIR